MSVLLEGIMINDDPGSYLPIKKGTLYDLFNAAESHDDWEIERAIDNLKVDLATNRFVDTKAYQDTLKKKARK